MGTMDFRGLDDLQKSLRRMEQNAKKLNGTQKISFDKLFTSAFMRKYTHYSSIDALLKAGGFQASTNEEFESIPEKELDAHIAKCTKFKSWKAMLDEATEQYVLNQLGF